MTTSFESERLHEEVTKAAAVSGVLGAAARHHFASPGKQLRGRLAIELATALGVSDANAMALGAACELMHNASLVHDDVQDRDVLRRGRDTVWLRFGDPIAINLGDHLLAQAFAAMAAAGADSGHSARLCSLFGDAITATARGQSDEILRRDERTSTMREYERMACDKTGPLFAIPIQASLILSGASDATVAAASRGGASLGTAFQILDDASDFLDLKGRGSAGADLREGKLTWPMLHYLDRVETRVRTAFSNLLAARSRSDDEVAGWVRAMLESGAVDASFSRVDALIARAEREWRSLPESCQPILSAHGDHFRRSMRRVSRARGARA